MILFFERVFPDFGRLPRLLALPLAMTLMVFYVALLQLVFGARLDAAFREANSQKERPSAKSCLVLALIIVPFGASVMILVGYLAMSFSKH